VGVAVAVAVAVGVDDHVQRGNLQKTLLPSLPIFLFTLSLSRASQSGGAERRCSVKRLLLACLVLGCRGPAASPRVAVDAGVDVATKAADDAAAVDAAPDVVAQREPDGNDDPEDPGTGTIPASGKFVRVGRTWLSLTRICDLTPFDGALYAAHAYEPLGIDGATVTRYDRATGKLTVAFDWNRPGEPTGGGGAGQGFVRVHAIGGKLWVPDADPPYDGFGLVDWGTEGYVFVSDDRGVFAKAQNPARKDEERKRKAHYRPPKTAIVIPRAYHDLDVIRFQGKMWASTGSVPPKERAWHGSSPGALNVLDEAKNRFQYVVGYPPDATSDVWRLTYMVRFRDRLYAGIQEYYPRETNDYVVFDGEHLVGKRATDEGGAETLRWYADRGALYWIAIDKDGSGHLRVTRDGETWSEIAMPTGAGRPADVVRFRDGLVVLAERALLRLDGDLAKPIATWDDKKLFAVSDIFCAAPLAVYQGDLYAGSQKDGALYRFE
jgi:hypothetical protein